LAAALRGPSNVLRVVATPTAEQIAALGAVAGPLAGPT